MQVKITVTTFDISKPKVRTTIALLASRIIGATGEEHRVDNPHLPYMPTEGDTKFWTLDRGNDWKIKFLDANSFEILHRYQLNDKARSTEFSKVNEAVKAVGGILAYRMQGTLTVDMAN